MESTKLLKNDPPEVLVLPPNILEKLGINLGNIQSCSNGVYSKSGSVAQSEDICVSNLTGPNYLPGQLIKKECDGSSILETANLMKASVFLSPTFTNLKPNNVLNDLGLDNFDNAITGLECNVSKPSKSHSPLRNQEPNVKLEKNYNDSDNSLQKNKSRGKLQNSHNTINITSEEIIGAEKIKEIIISEIPDNFIFVSAPINAIITKNGSNLINNKTSVQLVKKNNNNGCDNNSEKLINVFHPTDCKAEENKVSITDNNIQDQTNKQFALVKAVDATKISKKVILENDFNEDHNKHEVNFSCETYSHLEINDNNNKHLQQNNFTSEGIVTSIVVIDENVYEEDMSKDEKCNGINSDYNFRDINKLGILVSKNKNISNDLEALKDETNLETGIEAKFNKDNLEICSKNKIINVNQNKVKSKLCIQGVEKPGGDNENEHRGIYDKDLKTYGKGKRTKFLKQMFLENQDCLKSNLDVDVNINLNVNNINSTYEEKFQKFCICKDFGYFSYYEKDNDYQHIHYWEQKGAEYSLDTLFSIYEEGKVLNVNITENDYGIKMVLPSDDEQNNSNVLNICWMSINSGIENSNDSDEINKQVETRLITQAIETKNRTIREPTKRNDRHGQDVNRETHHDVSPNFSKINNSSTSKNKNSKRKIEDTEAGSSEEFNVTNNFRKSSNRNDNNISKANINETNFTNTKFKNMSSENLNKNLLKETLFVYASKKRSSLKESRCVSDEEKAKRELVIKSLNDDEKTKSKLIKSLNENQTDGIVNEETNKTDHKISKKRKSSLPFNEGSSEIAKKKKIQDVSEKLYILCGVCKAKVESCKWDNHVKGHCYIAWEEGQKFDFNNELLFNKLKQQLNDKGQLICVVCDKVIKRLKNFVSHVQECISHKGHTEVTDNIKNVKSGPSSPISKDIICGVCNTPVAESLWLEHIVEHNYMAWKDGEKILDVGDEDAVSVHFQKLSRDIQKFECKICGIKRKCAENFLKHIKNCGQPREEVNDSIDLTVAKDETMIICGVCRNNVLNTDWLNHIFKEHKYLAWMAGEPELDLNDSEVVYSHLYNLSKELGGLLCNKCGCRRKYVNSYLKHIENCDGENSNCTLDSTLNESNVSTNKTLDVDDGDPKGVVRCGVCSKEIYKTKWENHIKKEHFYKAWQEGQEPVDLEDEEKVYNHLCLMSKKYHGLTCSNCGTTRKYVKVFLQHIESCIPPNASFTDDVLNNGTCTCGVCGENVLPELWKTHAMKKHYNVAWLENQTPIDTNSGAAVEKCLKEYKQVYSKYACNVCGITRASAIGFFAHVVQCGKTEEEIDKHRAVCDICNNKYLLIYKNQHISMHRDQEYAKQRKLELQVEKEEKQKPKRNSDVLPEKRQAAERARHVIEKYQKQFKHNCPTCDFGADFEDEFKNHICMKTKYNFSDSDDSLELGSEQETDDTDDNCELLEEELEKPQRSHSKKKKHADPNPATAFLPFPVTNKQSYIAESAEDFRKNYLTSDILFPHWRTCKYEVVSDELLPNYSPTLEESCKLQLQERDWITLKKFESSIDQKWVSASFTGGCIQCVSWCPPHASDTEDVLGHVMSAAVHLTRDAPRLPADTCYTHHAMLQFWDYGNMCTKPEFALGIALDFGTIWSMDWCPSGTRDFLNDDTAFKRLGLLAIACSNGSAYIMSVPYPSTISDGEKKIFKLKPIAELRMSRGNRQKFQATAINWPAQKGHSVVVVGYSDGTTASYNLECDSPLLTDTEDDIKIYYPYQDERTHNTCVTAVTSFPASGVSCPAGSSSATGGSRAVCRGNGRGLRTAVTATSACFMPHWPDLLLAGNDAIVYQAPNVLSWVGTGRRLGSQQSCAGCAACGLVALMAPPAVRIVTTHPVHDDLNKITVALLQMKSLVDKKSKQKNDDLATKLEPVSYDDAIRKYGVQFKLADDTDRSYLQQSNKPRDHYPERFPLADVPGMAFNLSPKQHKKLAIATHSGFIFVLSV